MRIQQNVQADDVLFQRKHVLFVEGKDAKAVDPRVLDTLFQGKIKIEALGPSYWVKSVAEALALT